MRVYAFCRFGGARSCPGPQIAQAKFLRVLVELFYESKVKPVPFKGEDDGMARARIIGSDQERHWNETSAADAACGKGGVRVEKIIVRSVLVPSLSTVALIS